MFKFFKDPKWFIWAYIGSAIILSSIWVQVQIDVKINEWFGDFYDMIHEFCLHQMQLLSKNTGQAYYHLLH